MARKKKNVEETETVAPKKKKSGDYSHLVDLKEKLALTVNSTLNYPAAVADLDELNSKPRWVLPSGLLFLDTAIGGGMFEGKVARFYGPPGVSKTSLMDEWTLQCMSQGVLCVRLDPEEAFNENRLIQLAEARGFKWIPDLFFPLEPRNLEDLFQSAHMTMQGINPLPLYRRGGKAPMGRPDVAQRIAFFVDTISESPTKKEEDSAKDSDEKSGEGMASRARQIRAEMRKLSVPLAAHGASMFIAEQAIDKIGSFVGGQTSGGGGGIKFKSSQSVYMRNGTVFVRDGYEAGFLVRFQTEKCRFVKPRAKFTIPFYYDYGFNNLEAILLLLEAHKLVSVDKTKRMIVDPLTNEQVVFDRRAVESFDVNSSISDALIRCGQQHSGLLWAVKKVKADVTSDDIDEDDVADGAGSGD